MIRIWKIIHANLKFFGWTTNEIVNHEQNYELPLDHLDRGLRDVVECPNVRVRAVTLRLLQLDLYITDIEMDEFR